MTTEYRDTINFKEDVNIDGDLTLTGAVDLSDATVTMPTGQGAIQFAERTFTAADFLDGPTTSIDNMPENVILVAAHVIMTTAFGYSAGTTTGVSAKIGNGGDDDGFGLLTALGGSAGYRRPARGALNSSVVAGGSGGVIVTFVATGGTPVLSEVNAGAGKVVVAYIEV